MKRTLTNIIWGLVAFIAVSAVAGQVLMFGQGDTPAISMRWGFFYVVGGCGIPVIPKMIRLGEFHPSVIVAVGLEFVAGIVVFALLQRRRQE